VAGRPPNPTTGLAIVAARVGAGPAPGSRTKRPVATGANPYLVLAALVAALAISWVPVAILLIWLL
jgi:hypothetical protein